MNLSDQAIKIHPESDEAVIRDVQNGDRARFEVLMRRYNQRLFRTARAILRDDAEAEDAVQQAYLAAYSKLGQFRGEARFSTWLTKITVNEALRRTKKRARLADLALVEPSRSPSAPSSTPEETLQRREMRALLERAVDALPESYRVVFVMRDVEELSTSEAADCLGLSDEAVRVRLHRARRALREWLTERVDTGAGDVFAFAGERCDRIVSSVFASLRA